MSSISGLVSISFRKHSPEEIISRVKAAGLEAIEWGGDVHSPHGDLETAKSIRSMTEKAGLLMPEYGSYYIIGKSEPELFSAVLDSANALGTKIIRVWPGMGMPSDTISNEQYEAMVADAKRICLLAKDFTVALECHPASLTDEYHNALAFIRDVGMDNLKMMWQPNQYRPLEYNLDSIKALLPYVVSVHVFHWSRKTRLPLSEGRAEWEKYISLLSAKDLNYMLEFMPDDNIDTLAREAETLKSFLV
ncbi:MAG: sugar phosphate isomerase/epimerase [Clostridia bacterium]|nr:sugar phosphate isomerase/epimerase [Clostridia bacterium]